MTSCRGVGFTAAGRVTTIARRPDPAACGTSRRPTRRALGPCRPTPMSLLNVFKSSVSEYLGGEASPVRTSGGQDDESIPEPKDGGQPDDATGVPPAEPPATPDDASARRRRTHQPTPATPPVASAATIPLADVSAGAPPRTGRLCIASASPLHRLCIACALPVHRVCAPVPELPRAAKLAMGVAQLTLVPASTLTRARPVLESGDTSP